MSGAQLVKDIYPGFEGRPESFLTINDTLFFAAMHTTGRGLWRSDGTEAGTTVITASHDLSLPGNLTNVNGTLFYSTNGLWNQNTVQLWRSDGTPQGTTLIKTIPIQNIPLNISEPVVHQMLRVGNKLFLRVGDLWEPSSDLWVSDGTELGTVLIPTHYVNQLTNVNDTLFFTMCDLEHGCELWKSDGSTIQLVKDIYQGIASSVVEQLTSVGNKLFFIANDGMHGRELWVSDGTEAGTYLIKDIWPGWELSLIHI
mgnify:FL=1